jgi:phage terminase large subunit
MWFDQEIAALFTAFTGKIYDEFDPNIHVRPIEYNPLWTNVWALDYGWANPFCCYDVMIDPEDRFYVWREYQVSNKTTFEHGGILPYRTQPEHYHVDWGAGDPRGPDQANTLSIVTGVQIASLDIASLPHESWSLGVEYVKRLLKVRSDGLPGLIIDPSCTHLIRQMEQLRNPDDKEGINSREGQHKHDDHGPDAIRYLIGQYFHNGIGSTLSDIYAPGQRMTEAATFFQHNHPLGRYGKF